MSASRKKKERKLLEAEKATLNAQKNGKEKKTGVDRALRDVLIVIAAVILIAAIIVICVSCHNHNQKNAVIATIGKHEVKTPMMNFAYMDAIQSFYNNYSSYISLFLDPSKPLDEQECSMDTESDNWGEFFVRQAGSNLSQYYNICDWAEESGYEMTEEDQAQIDTAVESLKSYAESLGRTADGYLEDIYGKGSDLETYKEYIKLQVIASGCYSAYNDSIEIADDEISAKYAEDPTAFDTVSYYMISKSASEFAEPAEGTTTPEIGETERAAAKAAAEEIVKDFDTAELSPETKTKAPITTSYGEEAANWLYGVPRKEGDVKMFTSEDENTYYVFYYLNKDNHDYNTVNYQSIVISADTEAADVDAALEQAFATYNEIKDQINADNFADIAAEYGLNVIPGENVSKDSIDESVQSWLFDKNRKENDIEGFNVGTAYYLYLYEGAGENANNLLVKNQITTELLQQWEADHAHTNEPTYHTDKFKALQTDLVLNKTFSSNS